MRHALFFLIGLTVLAACSPASAVPSPTSAPQATPTPKSVAVPTGNQPLVSTVKAGDWVGSGENNFSIAFTVGEGGNAVVKGISVTFTANCGARVSNITETIALTENLVLNAGALKFTNANYEITGRAVAADRIEGTLKADGISLGKLGQCSLAGVAWTASPK